MRAFNINDPDVQWFNSWRERVALAKMAEQEYEREVWGKMAASAQMRYVTLAAIAVVKEAKHEPQK